MAAWNSEALNAHHSLSEQLAFSSVFTPDQTVLVSTSASYVGEDIPVLKSVCQSASAMVQRNDLSADTFIMGDSTWHH